MVTVVRAHLLGLLAVLCLLPSGSALAQPTVNVTYAAEEMRVGFPIHFVTLVSGMGGPLEFQFWRYDGTTWHLGQAYSPSATYTWTPTNDDVRLHNVQVWVRAAGSSADYDAWASTGYFAILGPLPLTVASLYPDVPLPSAVNTPMTWTATVSGGTGGAVEYKFVRLDADGWKIAQEYSPANSYTYTPGLADIGNHVLQVWVRNAGSTAAYDAWRGASFVVSPLPPPRLASLTSSVPLPVYAGTTVAWTVGATGGIAPLQYQFVRLDPDGWKIVQPYGAAASYSWTPGVADVGEHSLQAWVRSAGSIAIYDAWLGTGPFTVLPLPAPAIVSFATPVSMPAHPGTAITWTATAAGSTPLEYKFVRLDADGWKVVQEYGSANTYSWTPTLGDIGAHALQVWVRGVGSTAAYEAWRGTSFNIQPLGSVTLSPALPPRLPVGAPSIWIAAASGLPNPLYEFSRFDALRGLWQIVQAYSASGSYTWVPAAGDVGLHRIRVRARAAASAEPSDATADGPLFEVITPITVSLSVTPGVPTTAGTTLTFTAAVPPLLGVSKLLEYQFWRYDVATAAWSLVQNFTASTSHRWRPGAPDVGTHVMQVLVREVGYPDAYHGAAGTGYFGVTCPSSLTVTQVSNLHKAPTVSEPFGGIAWVGTPVTFTAQTCGAEEPLEYQFVKVAFSTGLEEVLQDGPSNTLTWTPLQSESNVSILVRVRRSGASVAEASDSTMFTAWLPSADLAMKIRSQPFSATVGQAVTVVDTVTNRGAAPSAGCTINYDVNGVPVGTRWVPALAPGESSHGQIVFNMPALAPRSYWVFATIPWSCPDPNQTDNLGYVGVRITQ